MFSNGFAFLLGLAALGTLYIVIRDRKSLFDDEITADDRGKLLQLTIFILLPATIVLHEVGHAIAVKLFGGTIVDYGFGFYYGFVSHVGEYSRIELGWIALSGTLVNVVLAAIALAIFWFWPRSKPINFLLVAFAALQLANALIFYPILDAFGGIVGDWSTIYSTETPIFSITVAAIHILILVGAVLAWKSPAMQQAFTERTGLQRLPARDTAGRNQLSSVIARASAQAQHGWKHPVELVADAQAGGFQMVLRWNSGNFQRAVVVHGSPPEERDPHIEIHAAVKPESPGIPPAERPISRIDGMPDVDQLAAHITQTLDFVDTWDGANVTSMS